MAETWHWIDSGRMNPFWNMAWDEALLDAVASLGAPVLRFYGWSEPAASFGYSQRYEEVSGWTALRPLIRRPTGGGLVPHDADWTYSLVFPPGHEWHQLRATESYRRVHEWIRAALARLGAVTELASCCQEEAPGQCFAGAERFDVLAGGRKIAGAAQRRNRQGLLIQGSVQPGAAAAAGRANWEVAMRETVPAGGGAEWRKLDPSPALFERSERLVLDKYSRPDFHRKR